MMTLLRRKAIRVFMISLFLLAIGPLQGRAQLYVMTELATGKVIKIQDNVITLDSGKQFYPDKNNKKIEIIEIKVGDDATLRFFTDAEKINRYTEVGIGKNSLSNSPAPKPTPKGFK
jgi:hypothetical protein